MLLRPLIQKEEISHVANETDKVNILPVTCSKKTLELYEANESFQYLQLTGRLMMLSVIWHDRNVKAEKSNHERLYRSFHPSWPVCQCNYAKYIRGSDLGFSWEVIRNLKGVI